MSNSVFSHFYRNPKTNNRCGMRINAGHPMHLEIHSPSRALILIKPMISGVKKINAFLGFSLIWVNPNHIE